MPTYPVIHKETGEKKEMSMTMKEYSDWKDANPDWDKAWSEGCAGVGEVGHWAEKMSRTHPGWNDVLRKASKAPGSQVRPL